MHQISLPASDKSTSTHLCFVSVSHFGNSHNISDFFYYYSICDGDLSSVIIDVTIVIIWECHKPHLFKMANLICVCSVHHLFPHLFSLGPPSSWKHNTIEIRPGTSPKMACKCSSERKSHTSLASNLKLEMISLSEEGITIAQTCPKARSINRTARL